MSDIKTVSVLFKSLEDNELIFELTESADKGSQVILEKNFTKLILIPEKNKNIQKLIEQKQDFWKKNKYKYENKKIAFKLSVDESHKAEIDLHQNQHNAEMVDLKKQKNHFNLKIIENVEDHKKLPNEYLDQLKKHNENVEYLKQLNKDQEKLIKDKVENFKNDWNLNQKNKTMLQHEKECQISQKPKFTKIEEDLQKLEIKKQKLEKQLEKLHSGLNYLESEGQHNLHEWCQHKLEDFFAFSEMSKIKVIPLYEKLKTVDLSVSFELDDEWVCKIVISCKNDKNAIGTKNQKHIDALIQYAESNKYEMAILATQLEPKSNLNITNYKKDTKKSKNFNKNLNVMLCRPEDLLMVVSCFLSYFKQKRKLLTSLTDPVKFDQYQINNEIDEFYEIFNAFNDENLASLKKIYDKIDKLLDHQRIAINYAKTSKKKVRKIILENLHEIIDKMECSVDEFDSKWQKESKKLSNIHSLPLIKSQ